MICRDVHECGYTVKTNVDGESITVDTPSQRIMPKPRGRLTETDTALLRQPDTMTALASAAGLLGEKLPAISTARLRKASPRGIDFNIRDQVETFVPLLREVSTFPKTFSEEMCVQEGSILI